MLGRFVVKTRQIATLGSPGWGLSDELMTHPRKKNILLLKPETLFKIAVWQRSVKALRVTERE